METVSSEEFYKKNRIVLLIICIIIIMVCSVLIINLIESKKEINQASNVTIPDFASFQTFNNQPLNSSNNVQQIALNTINTGLNNPVLDTGSQTQFSQDWSNPLYFIDTLAKWLWEPFFCLVYIELGLMFLYLTRAIAWTKSFPVFLAIFKNLKSTSGKRINSYKTALLLHLTRRAMAGKKSPPEFVEVIQNVQSVSSDKIISQKKAFLSALGATVGLGNIAGVGTAIHLGGPGALFWMCMSAFFGMFFRMVSTYMTIKHRPTDENSLSFATPMVYLEKYLTGTWAFIPKLVAGLLLIMGIVLYNLVQSNSLAQAVHNRFGVSNLWIAFFLTISAGIVILGGVKKIVDYCSALSPVVSILYVVATLLILISHPIQVITAIGQVFTYAFLPSSVIGGIAGYTVLGAMQLGVSRGVFSHMSGMGTSAFFQGANKEEPAIGAFMSAIEPFVDTVIICNLTGLVILSFPYWQDQTGAHLAVDSFESGLGFFGLLVVFVSIFVFAFTTISAFAHISERCYKYLGGTNYFHFRVIFIFVTFIGPFLNLQFVWSLSDVLIAIVIIFHLVPLMFITIINREEICKDLKALKFKPKDLNYQGI